MVDVRSAARLTLLFLLALTLLALAPLPFSADIESRAGAAVLPLSRALRHSTRPLAELVLNAGQIDALTRENADLRGQLTRLEAEAAALREANVRTAQEAALVAAVGADPGRYLPAAVVARDPSPARRAVVVDRGSAQGVASGQPVLGAGAVLVGVVTDVDAQHARVRLLSDAASTVAAVVQQSRVQAALTGSGEGLRLEFVRVDTPVEPGDLVLSSALGGRLPPGLLIGRVTAVQADPRALFARVTVDPLADYSRIEQVLILTNFAPVAVPGANASAGAP